MDLKTRVLEVLKSSHLMSLATRDDGGLWVADVIFIHDDSLRIYWMSHPDCRHSKAIAQDGQVAGTITASNKTGDPNLGLQFSGRAERIEGARYDLATKHLFKRGHVAPASAHEAEKLMEGDSWYQLVPSKIRLIDEKNFGYIPQDVPLS